MEIKQKLQQIGATDIKSSFNNDNLIGSLTFKVKGVSFQGQFDLDNEGLYAIELKGDLLELKNLFENGSSLPSNS